MTNLLTRKALRESVIATLIEKRILVLGGDGIPRMAGKAVAIRATRARSAEVGWECEVEDRGRRTGELMMADVYLVAEVAPNGNEIVALRCWDASLARPHLRGQPFNNVNWAARVRALGLTGGVSLHMDEAYFAASGADLTERLR